MNATCVFVQLRLFVLCQMENAAIASLPRGKLRWLQVLLKYQFSKADAVMLIQDVEDVNALLAKLAKQFPSFRRHLSALQREIDEMNRETKLHGEPIDNDARKQNGNDHVDEPNESEHNSKCKDKEDIAMEKKGQPTDWHEHKRAWAELLERNGIPRRAYAMLLEQVHDLNALVARLKAIPNVKHLAKPLIDDQRRRVLLKLMTTVAGAENRRRLFLEQLVCLGHHPEIAEKRVQNAVFQLKSEPGCNSDILQMVIASI